jgi:hypothetical protein
MSELEADKKQPTKGQEIDFEKFCQIMGVIDPALPTLKKQS